MVAMIAAECQMLLSWLLLGVQLILSIVFIVAATGKVLHADTFLASLRLSHVPEPLVMPIRVILPIVEVILGATLVLGNGRSVQVSAMATAALLVIFSAWTLLAYVRKPGLQCGCFGSGAGEIGPRSVGRNTALLGLAIAGAILAERTPLLLPDPTAWTISAAIEIAVTIALLVSLRSVWPGLALALTDLDEPDIDSRV